jgi:hypothetical protein
MLQLLSYRPRLTSTKKRAYLSSLPHPQVVDLLLHATTLHPDLPFFSFNSKLNASKPQQRQSAHHTHQQGDRRVNVYPQQPFPPSATSTKGLFSRSEANPNAPINFIRKIPPGPNVSTSTSADAPSLKHSSSAPPVLPQQTDAADEAGEDESRESTPASPPYPRPGNGLMGKLPPDEEDLEWLVDEDDHKTFSHVVYDEQTGEKIEEHGVPVASAAGAAEM